MKHEEQIKKFIGFTIDRKNYKFDVYLINPTNDHYKRVVLFTGAHASQDGDDLLQTSRLVKEKGELLPDSALLIDRSDLGELDFVIWYNLDLYPSGGVNPEIFSFSILKYPWNYKKNVINLPILNREGMRIDLERRQNDENIAKIVAKDKEANKDLYVI